MKLKDAKACVLRVGGTNCDWEIKWVLEEMGLHTEILHMNQAADKDLMNYQLIVFPGGFSYGDYVRAGAIWSRELITKMGKKLESYIDDGRLVLGICNGFQVLVEAGALPGDGKSLSGIPSAVLANNKSSKYECRWVRMKVERTKTYFARSLKPGQIISIPVGHGEGRFLIGSEDGLESIMKNGQVVLRYAKEDGSYAEGAYPDNPNGSLMDIAAICNKEGNVMGMMPHPERAFFGWQTPYAQMRGKKYADGKAIFEGAIKYIESC
uniref:Phosphoribosylformylglycinamidine synthase subunit PurQ n=1 Tax=Candidatus Methanomethylicus mesodigestus TaxID=1867258 RepID=A0A7C3IXD0_9CREN